MIDKKYGILKDYLCSLGSAAVAFSSGVDSTFLLKAAHEVLGENVIAVTARSCSFPVRETEEAVEYCRKNGIKQFFCDIEEMKIPGFADNPVNRCYLCKREIFKKIIEVAEANNISAVLEGSNMDDTGDYRPGMKAIAELGVKSPLKDAALYKSEIRELSRRLGLPTWKKPSFACLATRFVYGEPITEEKLSMVDKAEQLLMDMGFSQVRVRIHGTIARIEIMPAEFERLMEVREKVNSELRRYGFSYVSLDLQGYRTGSMNETIDTSGTIDG